MSSKHLVIIFFLPLLWTSFLAIKNLQASQTLPSVQTTSQTPVTQVSKRGTLVKDSALFQQPNNQSEIISTILADKTVTIKERKLAWYRTITERQLTGWISMLNIRFNGVEKRDGDLGIASVVSSVINDTLPTQSTGIRGFDEADLKKAQANFDQLAIVNSYGVSKQSAQKFAQQGNLHINTTIATIDEDN